MSAPTNSYEIKRVQRVVGLHLLMHQLGGQVATT